MIELPRDVISAVHETGRSRTDFLAYRVIQQDMPLRDALSNAWIQGAIDVANILERDNDAE